jgi:feruloyl esterase
MALKSDLLAVPFSYQAPMSCFTARSAIVPGMGHCGSGDEPNDIGQWVRPGDNPQHSLFSALQQWMENAITPDGVIATRFAIDGDPKSAVVKTRRLCPYPQVAAWNHSGSVRDAANYECP